MLCGLGVKSQLLSTWHRTSHKSPASAQCSLLQGSTPSLPMFWIHVPFHILCLCTFSAPGLESTPQVSFTHLSTDKLNSFPLWCFHSLWQGELVISVFVFKYAFPYQSYRMYFLCKFLFHVTAFFLWTRTAFSSS